METWTLDPRTLNPRTPGPDTLGPMQAKKLNTNLKHGLKILGLLVSGPQGRPIWFDAPYIWALPK